MEPMSDTEHVFIRDDFVTITPGEPFRLFPLTTIFKDGIPRNLKEIAHSIKLPPWSPPIKRGSHADDAPAVGHIRKLQIVGDGSAPTDGIYGIPDYTEEGLRLVNDGDFKYQSPEMIWDGQLEDSETGELIDGPFIVGTALLHMPHLGQAAALYSTDPIIDDGGVTMSETVTVPVSWLDRLFGRDNQPQPTEQETEKPPEPTGVEPDKFEALQKERDDMAARLKAMEDERVQGERIAHFQAELKDIATDDVYEILAGMDEAEAGVIVQHFKALSEQVRVSNLEGDVGSAGDDDPVDPKMALHAAIEAKAKEDGISYPSAMEALRAEQPDLFGGGD